MKVAPSVPQVPTHPARQTVRPDGHAERLEAGHEGGDRRDDSSRHRRPNQARGWTPDRGNLLDFIV